MKKPWGGRFTQRTSETVEAFTESISFDRRLWRHDIMGSIAHAEMLGRQGIIPRSDARKIVSGLRRIAADIESGRFRFRPEFEDIHMNIEAALIDLIGDAGRKLHTARSRNDQVALDLRLYLREETNRIVGLLQRVQKALLAQAEDNLGVVMPGYTHMQRAQPVLLAHHLLAYIEMFQRDRERLADSLRRTDVLPLGSCALAGTTLPVDRDSVAAALGFGSVSRNSMDSVSDRDFALEFLSASAIAMVHLSRIAEELVLWSSEEFSFVEIPDRFTTGSSIMPQKKNPDVAELTRGKSGRVFGNLMALLTVMKALPLSYNRDMQEDKLPVFDTVDTLSAALSVFAEMIPEVRFRKERMAATAGAGFSTATDLAEYLVRKGMPFRKAHEVTGRIVLYCIRQGVEFSSLTPARLRTFSTLIGDDIRTVLDPARSVEARISYGGTAAAQVRKQIAFYKKRLS